MEGKVSLYNSDDVIIGETFMRRAKQLVRQQRAMWVDDSRQAVRFHPGMENVDVAAKDSGDKYQAGLDGNEFFLAEVERRMRERKRFIIHSFIIMPLLLFLLAAAFFVHFTIIEFYVEYDWAWLASSIAISVFTLTAGIHLLVYAVHLYFYVTNKRARRRIAGKLAAEIAALKSM